MCIVIFENSIKLLLILNDFPWHNYGDIHCDITHTTSALLGARLFLEFVILRPLGRDEMIGLILGLRLAKERRCYKVTPSLIGWAQA